MRVHPTGSVTVFTGSHSHGQGHETTFAQVVAARLGIPIENVDVVHGDTGRVPFGMGTYGSRSLAVGGTAIVKALDKIVAKGKKIAAHLLEAAEATSSSRTASSRWRAPTAARRSARSRSPPTCRTTIRSTSSSPDSNETAFYDPTNFTFPAGTHICEVEIDPDTGRRPGGAFAACDDFGNIINPMIVEGQVHGGVAQGIGQALLENCVYDAESGQLLTGSYMDYAMPRADDLPSFKVGDQGHAVHAQPARRQGLRRGGRDRRAGGDDERRARRARGRRRQAHRHARVAASRVAGDPIGEARVEENTMYASNCTKREVGRQRRGAARANPAARRSPADRASSPR